MKELKALPLEGIIPGGERYEEFQPKRFKQLQYADGILSYIFDNKLQFFKVDEMGLHALCKHDIESIKHLIGKEYTESTTLHTVHDENGLFWIKLKEEILFVNLIRLTIENRIGIDADWEGFDYNAKARQFAFIKGNGLYLLDLGGKTGKVYESDNDAITAGQTAARDEFGNEKGTFWSNNGKHLAFFVTDQSHVTNYPLVDIEDPIATVRNIRYPMSGKASEETTLGIYDLTDKKVTFIEKQGAKEDYLCCISFTPNDNQLTAAELTRDQQHCRLNLFDVKTGRYEKTVLEEDDDRYTEPEHAPVFIGDGHHFIWQSRRNGFNHPYLCSIDHRDTTQLFNLDNEMTRLVGFDENDKKLLIECVYPNVHSKSLFSVSLDGKYTLLSEMVSGTHKATLLNDGWFIDEFESPSIPYRVNLCRLNGEISTLAESTSPLVGYSCPETEIGTWQLNSYEICYRLVKPHNFDEKEKYPMVCYFYGGPHVQLIRSDWNNGTAGFEYMMAQAGFLVFTIDPRGSANRGKRFEQEIWRNIGGPQIEDYIAAVNRICDEKAYIDRNRIGVNGWSFGGFISTSLMLKAGDLFKVGVAGGPVTNWRLYEVMYTERYMQTPEKNPQGYDEHDLSHYVHQLKGKLMLIHCNTDPVVLWQNSLNLLKQAVTDDKQIDYSVYVGFPHNVRGSKRVHLMKKIRNYFVDNL
ncbi:MAG: S9 family peptidase [Paludibacteraceae bacterium]|nr:S9 family peptidase [Paludibacteraceae bacterium]